MVSSANLSPDGKRLVVLTYEAIHLFERRSPTADLLSGKHHRTVLEARQCEAICFDGDDVVFTNEQREMFRVRLAALEDLDAYVPAAPRASAVHVGSGRLGSWWQGVTPLPLRPDFIHCPALPDTPVVHLGWTDHGVAVRIDWPVRRDAAWPACVLEILLAPAGEPPQPRDAIVYRGTLASDGVRLNVRPAAAAAAGLPGDAFGSAPAGGWSGDRLWFEAILPLANNRPLRAGATIHADVLVFEPATAAAQAPPCGLDAAAPFEWAWAGSSSTQPWTNPILWGSVTLAGQPD